LPSFSTFNGRCLGVSAALALTAGLAVAGSASAAVPDSPSASVANNTLTVDGTDGGDSISVGLDATNANTMLVDFGNGTQRQSFDRSTFNAVAVFLGRGDDTFQVIPGGDFNDEALAVDGQAGNDTISGSAGNDTISGGAGDDLVRAGAGNDVIFGDGGDDSIFGGIGIDTEVLGGGADTSVWNPGDGSDVVNGSTGTDTLQFNGSNAGEKMSLSANGTQAVFVRDVANIRMDLDNIENVNVEAIGGSDAITVNDLAGTDVRQANIDLSGTIGSGAGDGVADTVTVNGTNRADNVTVSADNGATDVGGLHTDTQITGSDSTTDALQVNTLGGNDTVDVSAAAKAQIGVGVDLGIGQR
jgi:RTX calcium-binding nonapeptide repeat (4 copies)